MHSSETSRIFALDKNEKLTLKTKIMKAIDYRITHAGTGSVLVTITLSDGMVYWAETTATNYTDWVNDDEKGVAHMEECRRACDRIVQQANDLTDEWEPASSNE